ncbi:hypothetical protein N7492_003571 [Penicillium capsulatum]|uniref:Uncharacterized protein n=1 Tax=Penicillium capsulatum TaxID=69766 RepID=A0A9W9IRE1_9EURO|nr:hypothetical protein N7492_003571 [Penicillium capsulatum]
MAASGQPSELPQLVALIKTMTIPQLKDLLRNEGLALSGVKAVLQVRIIDCSFPHLWSASNLGSGLLISFAMIHGVFWSKTDAFVNLADLERLCNSEGNCVRYDAMKRRIQQFGIPGQDSFHANPAFTFQPPPVSMPPRPAPMASAMSPIAGHIAFKESPFFTVQRVLAGPVECKVREQTRDHVELKVAFDSATARSLEEDPNLRVMVFCAADSGLKPFTKSDIAFPHQVELKVNLDDVKANLRGLKNKPGTTQPADITNYMRKKTNYTNNIMVTWALTQKKFFVLVQLVMQHPVEELVAQLKTRKIISKEQVLREMKNRAEDTDIVATSSIMSLKCPLSTLRIQVPCRSVVCTHNQCFDASSFLELQKQAPTWICPICSKSTSFESLQVDQYVDEILRVTSVDQEQVVVQPDGEWSAAERPGNVTPGADGDSDDDDDLIQISEPIVSAVKQEAIPTNILLQRTPVQSREASTPSSAARPSSKKRPASQVIDLTNSDDEEDQSPAPLPKRPALSFPVRGPSSQDSYQPMTGSPLNTRSYPSS